MSMNVAKAQTTAMLTLSVQILLGVFNVTVYLGLREMESLAMVRFLLYLLSEIDISLIPLQTLMSAVKVQTTAMLMPSVQTQLVVSNVPVYLGLKEMESHAQVGCFFFHAVWSIILLLQLKLDGFLSDINECNRGTDNCHVNAQCTDIAGGFQCDCMPGFEGSGISCTSKTTPNKHHNVSYSCYNLTVSYTST